MKEIACFISPHGYGHATRAIAVLESLADREPNLLIHIYTTVPESLFHQTLTGFIYHRQLTDIGLIQRSALVADIPATIRELEGFLPFRRSEVDRLAALCCRCSLVLCDIAPLGIVVAAQLGIPSVLVENFTWDWIYQPYIAGFPQLNSYADQLQDIFARADYHIQTEPVCRHAPRNFLCGPIFRRQRETSSHIRKRFGCEDRKLVLVTMGGVGENPQGFEELAAMADYFFVYSGQQEYSERADNVLLLDRDSDLYHPDLVAASDIVVCKAGYSTIAECCQAGARVMSISRDGFAESAPLQSFVARRLGGTVITQESYEDGAWLQHLAALAAEERPKPMRESGAASVAALLASLL
ncbi:MAG: hypothetical protein ACWGOX_03735 [Desulforhopalus sp.]